MIGKQINCYLTTNDQRRLLESIHGDVGCVLIKRDHDQPYRGVESFLKQEGDWALAYLCQPSQVDRLLRVISEGQPDPTLIAAIQFIQPMEEKGELQAGRFWYAPIQPSSGDWFRKPDEFVKWAEAVFRISRRQLASLGDGFRIGAEAKALVESGAVKLKQ